MHRQNANPQSITRKKRKRIKNPKRDLNVYSQAVILLRPQLTVKVKVHLKLTRRSPPLNQVTQRDVELRRKKEHKDKSKRPKSIVRAQAKKRQKRNQRQEKFQIQKLISMKFRKLSRKRIWKQSCVQIRLFSLIDNWMIPKIWKFASFLSNSNKVMTQWRFCPKLCVQARTNY